MTVLVSEVWSLWAWAAAARASAMLAAAAAGAKLAFMTKYRTTLERRFAPRAQHERKAVAGHRRGANRRLVRANCAECVSTGCRSRYCAPVMCRAVGTCSL